MVLFYLLHYQQLLVASKRKDIVGDYKHAQWLFILGWVVVAITAFLGVKALPGIAAIWNKEKGLMICMTK